MILKKISCKHTCTAEKKFTHAQWAEKTMQYDDDDLAVESAR